jgi:hypothetical protein
MNSKRTFYVLLGLNCLLVLGIFGAAYGIDQLLVAQSKKIVGQRLEIQTLDAQTAALGLAKKDVTKYTELAAIAKSIVPQDKDQAQTVREIVNIAAANGIKLGSVSFPSSTLGAKATGSLSTLTLSQLTPVKGINGVYSLKVVVQSDTASPVPYSKFISFLAALEHNRRTALVSNITLTPDAKNPNNISFSLSLDEYIKS